jgi:hypothetical protein
MQAVAASIISVSTSIARPRRGAQGGNQKRAGRLSRTGRERPLAEVGGPGMV